MISDRRSLSEVFVFVKQIVILNFLIPIFLKCNICYQSELPAHHFGNHLRYLLMYHITCLSDFQHEL